MAAKIRRNDEVIILTGKDKGKHGKVKAIVQKGKAIVDGINLAQKHQKPMPNMNRSGGLIKKEMTISVSNLRIFNTVLNKSDRIGFKIKDGKKIRVLKSNGEIIK